LAEEGTACSDAYKARASSIDVQITFTFSCSIHLLTTVLKRSLEVEITVPEKNTARAKSPRSLRSDTKRSGAEGLEHSPVWEIHIFTRFYTPKPHSL
jgi:hypothetical protein